MTTSPSFRFVVYALLPPSLKCCAMPAGNALKGRFQSLGMDGYVRRWPQGDVFGDETLKLSGFRTCAYQPTARPLRPRDAWIYGTFDSLLHSKEKFSVSDIAALFGLIASDSSGEGRSNFQPRRLKFQLPACKKCRRLKKLNITPRSAPTTSNPKVSDFEGVLDGGHEGHDFGCPFASGRDGRSRRAYRFI